MNLNPDGGVTVSGVTLNAQQVAEIKAAQPTPPSRRTGWWLCGNHNKDPNPKAGDIYLGASFLLSNDNGAITTPDGSRIGVTNCSNVIFWGTA